MGNLVAAAIGWFFGQFLYTIGKAIVLVFWFLLHIVWYAIVFVFETAGVLAKMLVEIFTANVSDESGQDDNHKL